MAHPACGSAAAETWDGGGGGGGGHALKLRSPAADVQIKLSGCVRHSLVMVLWILSARFQDCPNTEGQFEEPLGGIRPKYAGQIEIHIAGWAWERRGKGINSSSSLHLSPMSLAFSRPLCYSFGSLFTLRLFNRPPWCPKESDWGLRLKIIFITEQ